MIYDLVRVCFRPAGLTGAWTGLTGRGPDSPAICSDTPGLWWSRHYGFESEFSRLGSPDTPRVRSDNSDFGFRVSPSHDRSDRFCRPVRPVLAVAELGLIGGRECKLLALFSVIGCSVII